MAEVRFTKSELMAANEEHGLNKEAAYALIVLLRQKGVLVEDGHAPSPNKRGKGETYYKGYSEDIAGVLGMLVFPNVP